MSSMNGDAKDGVDSKEIKCDPQMEFGKRLLPQVVDHYAQTEPTRVYASIPKSADMSDGFQDVTMAMMASAVNSFAWWIREKLGENDTSRCLSYVGSSDLRYAIVFLASIKCGWKVLFISPRNTKEQNSSMIERANCEKLLFSHEMQLPVSELQLINSALKTYDVPSLREMLGAEPSIYPFEKSFSELQDEQCLILHSSGSTGNPKLVYLTHGTFSVTDNDRNMPVPEGRRPQNGAQFNFSGGGKFYSCFPPYHLAGVQAYIILPIFSTAATVVFGLSQVPPSGHVLADIMKHQHLRAFYVPPFIIEQWASEPGALCQAKQLAFVLYGGGPLSPEIGNKLSEITDVCQMYGSLEVGQVQMLVPRKGDWAYLEPNPFEECDMQFAEDNLYEMVLHQHPDFAKRRSLWHNFPGTETWRTGDLFAPHPSKPGLWRFHSRVDDIVVLSSSHKLRAGEMETNIRGDPLLSGALIVGQGKPEPLLIVEPKPSALDMSSKELVDQIWPTVIKANAMVPTYGKIIRSRLLVASPEKPFVRAPKGTVVRRLTAELYAAEIEAAYSEHANENATDGMVSLESVFLEGIKQFIRSALAQIWPEVSPKDDENVFVMGMNSLMAADLGRKLRLGLSRQMHSNLADISLRMIYTYPTVPQLAEAIYTAIFRPASAGSVVEHGAAKMREAVDQFTADLPQAIEQIPPLPSEGINVVLIGPRGALGPNIVRVLLEDPRVANIYCLNRSENGRERLRTIFRERDLACDVDDARLIFFPVDLGKPLLGLTASQHAEILGNAHVLIHNAWKVDFSLSLDSYKVELVKSVRTVLDDFSAKSPLRPRIVFVSSVSSVQDWASVCSTPVTEEPLDSYDVVSPLGYGQSKHVSERILTLASERSNLPVTILRVGQVAGPTSLSGGKWSQDQWIPSLAMISKALNLIPIDLPHIDWVPEDIMGRIICDVSLRPQAADTGSPSLQNFNLVNPHLTPWTTFAAVLERKLGPSARKVSLIDWVDTLARTGPAGMPEPEATLAMKILPFFQHLAETAAQGTALQPLFETVNGVRASETMAKMSAVDESLIEIWCRQWGL
ncbi:MAG: putative NRPS-like protein biosynthetic cluster [Peltula sp. TS41687]|nr:MAG: putative NRPS-like protein biosynthetic cluster [Peltula sp. TS41687]